MLTTLIIIIGLSALIIGHEAGHFFVAKLFKLKVEEFGFGLPPRIFGLRRYVGATTKKWHFFWRKREKPETMSGLKPSDTAYSFNFLPFGGFVRIAGENDGTASLPKKEHEGKDSARWFVFQPAWKRSVVILAGITTNFLIGWFIISAVFMAGSPSALIIESVQTGSPGEKAGFMTGDIIQDYKTAGEFIGFVDTVRGTETKITVNRNGENLTIKVVPRVKTDPGEGAIGVLLQETGLPKQKFFTAIIQGFWQSILIAKMTIVAFYTLLANLLQHGSLVEGIVGPVGILGIAARTGEIGFAYVAQLLALISINLAIMNLVPFPALDGGRFLFILVEKIKGSRVSFKTEALVNGIGFLLLIILMITITFRDIARML